MGKRIAAILAGAVLLLAPLAAAQNGTPHKGDVAYAVGVGAARGGAIVLGILLIVYGIRKKPEKDSSAQPQMPQQYTQTPGQAPGDGQQYVPNGVQQAGWSSAGEAQQPGVPPQGSYPEASPYQQPDPYQQPGSYPQSGSYQQPDSSQ
ncbi:MULTISPECIES: hypothetical protein [unclassified Actinobaculum]|uniref:hypothetical protein n=1 Tax=unclassified Actinobaculum TaxID=2609299 RepID=UPI000D5297B3|nr:MULTISPECIES: hypothetical protein [unclassified Actinobaculum]AWE41636.1 hypothetical protein DDD63_01400 [Actinobaculum sp. 313]RTE49258.1 hypothetical protein EKN07_06720 [Actinobaculum sp. 352]